MVGLWVVAQHTPFSVISNPPLLLIVPPLVAEELVMLPMFLVVSVGTTAFVVKLFTSPNPVPALLVANALA